MSFVLALLPIATILAAEPGISGRVVGPDGKGIAEAVVFVQSPVDSTAAATRQRAAMDQINKTFVPGVLPIVVGSEVRFPNHDQIHHHVYSFSRTKTFELPLYKGQDALPVRFDKPGVVNVGCNIHDWMSGIILVLPTRHYAMTDANGRFTLPELPAGDYTLVAWHAQSRAKLDETAQKVQVTANAADATFTLALEPAKNRPAIHGSRRTP
jgi:plastocyanin